MRIKLLEKLTSTKDCYTAAPKSTRTGILAALFLYSIFGILDKFMMPETYHYAWVIRYMVMAPSLIIFYILSFSKGFLRNSRFFLTIIVICGQLGVELMIMISKPYEGAFSGYYAGLILVLLWAVIIFRLAVPLIITTSITNIVFYNIIAIGVQGLGRHPLGSKEFGLLLNNNFFLISASVLAVLGAIQLNNYKKKLQLQNVILNVEKKELAKAKYKAEESDKLKSAFLANMSHEIRTPMNAILGFGELLKNPGLQEHKREKYVNIIQSKGNQLLQLINDIIDLSKIEANYINIVLEPLNINQLFDELNLTYQRILQIENKAHSVKLIFQKSLSNNECIINADENRVKQILCNLLDNAIKFTEKGEIIVGYDLIKNITLQFYVKDTGIGIPNEKQVVIFERFRQAAENPANKYGGTGLGLSIVKSLVTLMGGKIWVKSEPQFGASFYFTLPYNKELKKANNNNFQYYQKRVLNLAGKTILLAEDDSENYMLIEELLNGTQVKLLWAKDGNETIEMALGSNEIDLILMDIKMPYLNGYEAAKKIKSVNAGIPIIAQTAYAMDDERNRAFASQCNDYISKPIDHDELFSLIAKYLV